MPEGTEHGGRDVAVARGAASPYATGGGGTVLEHAYGAVLLARLLQRGPVRGLGDDVTPVEVRFQQAASHPVDDLVVVGRCATGQRVMFVGVRRNPTIGAGSPPFVGLLADYLRMVVGHRAEFDTDRWRLGLAVAAPHTGSAEVATLAWIARRQRSDAEFRAAVAAPRATSGKVRERLRMVDAAVAAAATPSGIELVPGAGAQGLTWHLLRALRILHLTLEGDDPADRCRVVTELSPLAGGNARATDLWRHLLELSAGYAQAAATVDRALLRRDLVTRIDLAPLGLAPLGLAPFGLAPFGLAPLGLAPLGLAPDAPVYATDRSDPQPASGLPAVRVCETDPRQLGVHASIRVDGVGVDQPSYIERDIDGGERGVRALLGRAAERGGFVLLVGGSSVGKTRSAYEAVRAVLPDWWLVHPAGSDDVTALGARPPHRTVVWLDEIQRYFGDERGLIGGVVRTLLRAPSPVVIVGTIWPDRYLGYTETPAYGGSDAHASEREVLELADVALVGDTFSAAERKRAEAAAAHDRLLAAALGTVGYGLTQTLAAAPHLVKHWEIARTVYPYAWAILVAAVDVSLLGAEAGLPEMLLRRAAPGYCTDRQRAEAPADWFERGLAYATRKLHGATAALVPVGGTEMGETVGYRIADYLLQHVGRARATERVPVSVWDAILADLGEVDDVLSVAESASARLLYRYAVPLYRRAADAGSRRAADQWIIHVGDPAGLDDLRARAARADGGTFDSREAAEAAAGSLAEALVRLGELDQLRALFRPASPLGQGWRLSQRLAQVLADRGAVDELRLLADRGDVAAAEQLATVLARPDDAGELRTRAEIEEGVAAPFDDPVPAWSRTRRPEQTAARTRLASYLAHRGEVAELAARTDSPATRRLFTLLRHRGDVPGLRRLAEARPGIGVELVQVLAHRGDVEELITLAAGADEMLLDRIARVFVHRGALDQLRALTVYHWPAADLLAEALADRGDLAGLAEFARQHGWGADRLVTVLVARGDLAGLRAFAEVDTDGVARQRLNTALVGLGALDELADRASQADPDATGKLARALADRGDADGARRVLRKYGEDALRRAPGDHEELVVDLDEVRARADSGDLRAASRLASALTRRGDLDQLRVRAAGGDQMAASKLVDVLVDRADLDALRSMADGGCRYASGKLAHVLVYRGHVDELTVRADSGDDDANQRLLDLLVRRGDLDALRRRADAGDHDAARRWTEIVADRGDAGRLRARAGHDPWAADQLADLLADRGDLDELRARADTHDHWSARRLARMLADRGALDEVRARADAGDTEAQSTLAGILADRGDVDALRARVKERPDDHYAAGSLVRLLVQRGELAEARRTLLAQVLLGDSRAAQHLPELLVRLGQHDRARQLTRHGLNADGSPAGPHEIAGSRPA